MNSKGVKVAVGIVVSAVILGLSIAGIAERNSGGGVDTSYQPTDSCAPTDDACLEIIMTKVCADQQLGYEDYPVENVTSYSFDVVMGDELWTCFPNKGYTYIDKVLKRDMD
jgi:hypothetical protein